MREAQRRAGGSCVAQLPSCHEEPTSWTGKKKVPELKKNFRLKCKKNVQKKFEDEKKDVNKHVSLKLM
jgi:hypothetical protein